jgi:hypothetical protein
VHSFNLCLRVIGTGWLEKHLKVISGLPRLALLIALSSGDELLIEVTNIFVVDTLITAGSDCDLRGRHFNPPLVAFGAPLHALAEAAFPLLCTKMAPIASSPKACLVAMPGAPSWSLVDHSRAYAPRFNNSW